MSLQRVVRTAVVCVVVAGSSLLPSGAAAQPTTIEKRPCEGPECLSILSAGGLLGYLDGFPEYAGWPLDGVRDGLETQEAVNAMRKNRQPGGVRAVAPSSAATPAAAGDTLQLFGGLVGLRRWQADHPAVVNQSYLLMSGNNHPQQVDAPEHPRERPGTMPADMESFWAELDTLRPDAIGVGVEDVHRWLAQTTVQGVQEWLAKHPARPLVASNVVIAGSGTGINTTVDRSTGIKLGFSPDATVGFVDSVSVSFPCGRKSIIQHVERWGLRPSDGIAFKAPETIVDAEEGPCTASIHLTGRLRPARRYTLTIPGVLQAFEFSTHEVLTPRKASNAWNGLPVVRLLRKDGATPSSTVHSLAVMAFVGLELKDELPEAFRTWTRDEGCRWEKCHLDYLPPHVAARQLWELGTGDDHHGPILAAISDVADDELSDLLDEMPEIRVLSLAPGSLRLGRAAMRKVGKTPPHYSGDLSFGGVIDAPHEELARIMLRAEWNGETVQRGRAMVVGCQLDDCWGLQDPKTSGWTVAGVPLTSHASGDNAVYTTPGLTPGSPHAPWTAARYCAIDPVGSFDHTRVQQRSLWTNSDEFAGLLLDEVREHVKSDVALVPRGWIEDSISDWLQQKVDEAGKATPPTEVDWLSGFILQRLLYRVERFVRVNVSAATIGKTLNTIVKGAADTNGLCASGLGLVGRCPLPEIDVDELLLNIRRPDEGHFYSIALPVSFATAAGFDVSKHDTFDVLRSLDRRLRLANAGDCSTTVVVPRATTKEALTSPAAELELRRSGKVQRYIKLDPLTLELSKIDLREPEGRQGLFKKLPVDSSSLQDAQQLTVEADVDAAIADTRRFALHAPIRMRFDKKRVDDQVSYDRDEATVSLRGDYKKPWNRRGRLFAAFSVDTQFGRPDSSVAATRDLGPISDPLNPGAVVENATAPGPTVKFTTLPRAYYYASVGLSLPSGTRWGLKFANSQARLDGGWALRVPLAAKIADDLIDLDTFITKGAGPVLNDYYGSHLTTLTSGTTYTYDYGTRRQMRAQLDLTVSHEFPQLTLSGDVRLRRYQQFGGESSLATRSSLYLKPNAEWKVSRRLALVGYAEYTQVRIVAKPSVFSIIRYGAQAKLTSYFKWGHGFIFE